MANNKHPRIRTKHRRAKLHKLQGGAAARRFIYYISIFIFILFLIGRNDLFARSRTKSFEGPPGNNYLIYAGNLFGGPQPEWPLSLARARDDLVLELLLNDSIFLCVGLISIFR